MRTEKSNDGSVHGTTLKVYRFIYRQGCPVGIHEIQEALGMASSSTAHYHVQKLLAGGLIREERDGYIVDKVFFDNFIRIGRTTVPLQSALAAFFAASIMILITVARPPVLTSGYLLGLAIAIVAMVASILQTLREFRHIE